MHRRKDGRWQVSYRDEQGRPRTKAFKAKKDAAKFAAEVVYKKSIGEALPIPRTEGVYLDELAQAWIDHKRTQGRKVGWIKDWARILEVKFFPTLCQRPAHTIKEGDVLAVVAAHYANVSQTTRNRYIGYLKSIFQYGVERELIPANPLAKWAKGREPRRESLLTLEDLRAIQSHAAPHLAWALEVAWNIPVRPGPADLFALRFECIDFDNLRVKVVHSKVHKTANIQLSQGFVFSLLRAKTQSKNGYIIEYKGRKVGDVGKALASAARRAGLHYTPCMYDVRHLWITTMLDKGIEPSAIAYAAGTSVRMILANYYEPHAAERARIVEELPTLSEAEKEPSRKVVNMADVVQTRSATKKKGSR